MRSSERIIAYHDASRNRLVSQDDLRRPGVMLESNVSGFLTRLKHPTWNSGRIGQKLDELAILRISVLPISEDGKYFRRDSDRSWLRKGVFLDLDP